MRHFESQASLMTTKSSQEIWALWVDAPNWTRWDNFSKVGIDGEFVKGSTITCYSEGEMTSLHMVIVSSVTGTEFVTQSNLPFGNITAYHKLKSLDGMMQITHMMSAEISDEMADMFASKIWPSIQSGVLEAVNRLVNL